jgi:hypothetical protein
VLLLIDARLILKCLVARECARPHDENVFRVSVFLDHHLVDHSLDYVQRWQQFFYLVLRPVREVRHLLKSLDVLQKSALLKLVEASPVLRLGQTGQMALGAANNSCESRFPKITERLLTEVVAGFVLVHPLHQVLLETGCWLLQVVLKQLLVPEITFLVHKQQFQMT